MNTERDTYNQIEYARETGREKGRDILVFISIISTFLLKGRAI